ncbi:4Fe-4S dicluster domain-containing protein [Oscillochloris sp. ZM17-4]|uniref:heterodisulfide reductase-related iron-sulfur binding cluster n=1 Tax=Oscillochloris sp. ZM17-4 TaxID=2866714 RepID=UPI001C73C372|nr:heterodisulfide reductase-related iron-sulfur binding cluster [Oscillochloris sp. ZM17-4]MBX0330675.1 4Fe-4S dicluster domain-containing protein [Oscillochloris sp. ZM17-4]
MDDQIIAIREIYWNIDPFIGPVFLYGLITLTSLVTTWGVLRDIARWRRGRPEARIGQLPARAAEFLVQVFGQKKVLRDRKPGSMHALIFFGFLALFIGTDVIAVEEDFTVPMIGEQAGKILVGGFYQSYELILDTLGLVFVAGLIWAAWQRYRTRPDRLDNRRNDGWVLGVLIFLGLGGFLIEGLRIANQVIEGVPVYSQGWARLSYVGFTLATIFRAVGLGDGSPAALAIHPLLWYTHATATFAFIGTLPFSKFRHIIYTPLNTFFRDLTPKGALDAIPNMEAEIEKDEPRLGVATLGDLTWKRRMDLDACMRCGRCQSVCPAHASGAELSPKYIITKLADLQRSEPIIFKDGSVKPLAGLEPAEGGALDIETLPLYGNLFSEDELWACTTCNACVHECPAMIEHVDDIVDLRRNLTMIASEVPQGVKRVLEGVERQGNPWRLPSGERSAWTDGLEVPTMAEKEHVDVLYWVGCAPSYDERSRKVARAMVQIFQAAGVDFAILGEEETCTGDPARRMGEEMLFQAQAEQNIETMKQYTFRQVVTTCAHCFNSIKNEYSQFGGKAGVDYEVVHHTDFIAGLIAAGKITPTRAVNEKVAYHDPCYIGRYNDIYDSPRRALESIPGLTLVEAPERNRERAMCCGGGGGNVWLEGTGKRDINVIRLEQLTTDQPDTLALACPFCMVMFEDAAKNTGRDETLKRRDIAEIVLESITPAEG